MNVRTSSACGKAPAPSRAARLCGIVLAGMLAALNGGNRLCAQESAFRGSGQRRVWPADERQQPRRSLRATHRGFEVSTGPIVVISTTSPEDARQAAEQANQAWDDVAQLADRFTSVHRQMNFGGGAVQVVLDRDRSRRRDEPGQSLAAVGAVTEIAVSLAPGQAELAQQHGQLRHNVASAFFHAAGLDQQLPEWVCQGLAAYVGNHTADESATVSAPEAAAAGDEAAGLVQFLMEGNDGRRAGPFFELLREQLATAHSDRDANSRRNKNPLAVVSPDNQPLNAFVSELADELARWKDDPQIGQPLHPVDETDEAVRQAQQEMLFVLKLADRFAIAETGGIRTTITTFDKGRVATVLHAATAAKPPTLRSLLERITADDQPAWATVGPDGKLIWSSDEEQLRKLMGVDENRYQHAWQENRWVLQSRLADGRTLSGSLERNPEHPGRPLAKFDVALPK